MPTVVSAAELGWTPAEIAANPILQQLDGQPAQVLDYGDWMRAQDDAFQDETLGRRAAQDFRQGKLDF